MSDTPLLQHKIIDSADYKTLVLIGALVPDSIPAFHADMPKLISPTHHVVVQCKNLSEVAQHWLRPLVLLENELGKLNRKIRFVEVKPKVKAYFEKQGVEKALQICTTMREALVELGLATKKQIDTDFINPFLQATLKVLDVQTNTKAEVEKIYLKQHGEKFSGDISGVIGIVSETFTGSVVISFPEATFVQIMSRMFGEEIKAITKELEDGAAELTNIIFGQAKIILNEKGYGIKTALPSVITGKDHSVASTIQGITVVVPFRSDAGKFFVEICTSA